jgi:hypothetical protein
MTAQELLCIVTKQSSLHKFCHQLITEIQRIISLGCFGAGPVASEEVQIISKEGLGKRGSNP